MGKLKELYAEVWNERPHVCENCGIPIPTPLAHNFAHIRSKGARPDLKYEKSNIRLLCIQWNRPDNLVGCHTLEHNHPEKFRNRKKETI